MKKIIHVIGLPLIFVVSQFFMTIIATIIFLFFNNRPDLDSWIGTDAYIEALAAFFSKYSIVITLLLFIIFFPLFYHIYHKEVTNKKEKQAILNYLFLFFLGLSFSLLYNSILGSLNMMIPVTTLFDGNPNLLIALLSTVIIGPILEEYLFRGIVYYRLQKYVSIMKAILITSLLFALFHTELFQVIYAFIFNFLLIFALEKYDLKASIIVHMSSNLASIIFTLFIYGNLYLIELTLGISILLLIGSYMVVKGSSKHNL